MGEHMLCFFILNFLIHVATASETDLPLCHKYPNRFQTPNSEMVKIDSSQFIMGTNLKESYPAERPAHLVTLHSYWIDSTEVTNNDFKTFVEATNYKTLAEKSPQWEELKKQLPPGTPAPDASTLVPGSLVFVPPEGNVNLDQVSWWKWTAGANWRCPNGPGSTVDKSLDHPVVHVAVEDARAYCSWKKKRLPTEAEWEMAARGGFKNTIYAWGNEKNPQNKFMANTFQGKFPNSNSALDKYAATSPVKSFPPNNFGIYDMIGNVWEWTSDYYDETYYQKVSKYKKTSNPSGPQKSYDSNDPYAIKQVIKGGSFLCSDDYCINYRPSARIGAAFDSSTSHIGFRCVKDDTVIK